MLVFAVSIFLSAFLLFQVEPMIAKFILPWFGGTPSVWSTVVLFFQIALTGGYAYAVWLVGRVKTGHQAWVHIGLMVLTILCMGLAALNWPSPITPSPDFKQSALSAPVAYIFFLLTISVGLPFFVLATNGPLMQAWFSHIYPDRSYGPLYAISNVGSVVGLLAYPVLVEPSLVLRSQGWAWAVGFVLFCVLTAALAIRHSRGQPTIGEAPTAPAEPRARSAQIVWMALAATPSIFLLSSTNLISQDVAVIPFLWVLPLTVYLLTFILTFSGGPFYSRRIYTLLFFLTSVAVLYSLLNPGELHFQVELLFHSALLFVACMICHAELYALRPSASGLTNYYLMISIGGALGGIFVTLIAPLIFNGFWELLVALGMTLTVLFTVINPRRAANLRGRARMMLTVFVLTTVAFTAVSGISSTVVPSYRNFFGIIRIRESQPDDPVQRAYVLAHGITVHGLEYTAPDRRDIPTTYYVPDSGVGLAILSHPRHGQGLRVGGLGLGAGTIATYAQPGDSYRFYEINPVVVDLAQGKGGYFSFLKDSKGDVSVALGDARITLEGEDAANETRKFDVLVLDTFTGDAIPVHLATKEAFALYLRQLAPDGVIAAHVSNNHLDMQPVFWQLAKYYNLAMTRVDKQADAQSSASEWLLLSPDPAVLAVDAIRQRESRLDGYSTSLRLWTDDFSNLYQILK